MNDFLQTLSLYNFRNYKHLFINFNLEKPTLFVGDNGAGKTNILEAISIFGARGGLRGAKTEELQCKTSFLPWAVSLELSNRHTLVAGIDNKARKVFKVDSKVCNFTYFSQYLWITWITPKIDLVLTDGNSERRKFLDHLVSGLFPEHNICLKRYTAFIKERINVILKSFDDLWLKQLEFNIAMLAIEIHRNRLRFIELISEVMDHVDINLNGIFENRPEMNVYIDLLRDSRNIDSKTGGASFGPHKTEWRIIYKAKDIDSLLCSTGEQKLIIFKIIAATIHLYRRINNGCCLLLLDEVFAHLDDKKAKEIIALSSGAQCFFTSTDIRVKDFFDEIDILTVENGVVHR